MAEYTSSSPMHDEILVRHLLPPKESVPFDVVALTGSAGGGTAALAVLRQIPAGFPVPLIVMLHLPPRSTLVDLYRHLPFEVDWVRHGEVIEPGKVLICPPRSFVELLPDGTCVVSPCEGGAVEKPIDRFLDSTARSFGHRAIGVILSGMGDDAAVGACELRRAGARVLVQSEATAEQASMPAAAIAAGAADMVLPLDEIGHVIDDLVAGASPAQMRSEVEAIRRTFGNQSEIARLAREIDWALTPLGPVIGWPAELRLMVRTALDSPYPTAVWWGPELIQIYNDAWRVFLGSTKHPQALGGRARSTWPEIWRDIGPMVERVMARGEVTGGADFLTYIDRHGYIEEVFASFSYSPIRDVDGTVLGVYNTTYESTKNVVAERRMRALRTLYARMADAETPREACERAAAALATDPADVPFALLYLLDEGRLQGVLAGAAGVEPGSPAAPYVITLNGEGAVWPLSSAVANASAENGGSVLLNDLVQRYPKFPAPSPMPTGTLAPTTALLLPLRAAPNELPMCVLVLALSPHRPFDEGYRDFVDLIAGQMGAGFVQIRVKQREHERMEHLAELDRTKTEFFANVSHEFRTPLTLLLAPLEELLRRRDEMPAALGNELDVATRNSRRLLSLVNNLLDFSQIESRRQRANLVPLDLRAITMDVVSHFRSAIEAAGLRLHEDCRQDLPQVPVDAEMWTKIVSNLLSNAFKFTFEGQISVVLRAARLHAELIITDTGIGIPQYELSDIFKRFHRVRGARARTAEGAGIGLSIVHDLVSRMGGQILVRSRQGHGTSFTVWLPFKSFRVVGEPAAGDAKAKSSEVAADLADAASRWLAQSEPEGVVADLLGPPQLDAGSQASLEVKGSIVVVDDNADMRDYLRRLLGQRWQVETASNGDSGLEAAKRRRPDLILADVMMPGIDGFELLKRVRADAELKHTPVVLVTARAGEVAAIEGLMAGADDYIAKPFSPRELVARVQAVIDRARADEALRDSEQRLRRMVNVPHVGVMTFDYAGTLLDANDAFLKMVGLDRESLRSKTFTWRDFTPFEYVDASEAIMEKLRLTGSGGPYEKEYLRKDGSRIWMMFVATDMGDGTIVKYAIDISRGGGAAARQ